MMDRRDTRLILLVFYAIAFVVVGVKIVQLGAMMSKTNERLESVVDRLRVQSAKVSVLEDDQADAINDCVALHDQVTNEILAKRYCLREEAIR